MSHSPSQKTVLITGASTGIGFELAKLFAADGYHLLLNARNQSLLKDRKKEIESKYPVSVTIFSADLSEETTVRKLYNTIKEQNYNIDVLVNNAGFGALGAFAESDLEHQMKMVRLNISALTILTRLFLQDMVKKTSGKILNVASIAAYQPGPLMAVYYATKAYVLSFSEALSEELRGTGITVTTLCPGPTRTEFQHRAGTDDLLIFKLGAMEASKVALIGYRALEKGKRTVIAGGRNRLMRQFVRLSPTSLVMKIVRKFQESKKKI